MSRHVLPAGQFGSFRFSSTLSPASASDVFSGRGSVVGREAEIGNGGRGGGREAGQEEWRQSRGRVEAEKEGVKENQRTSKRNRCLEFLWLDHNNKYK